MAGEVRLEVVLRGEAAKVYEKLVRSTGFEGSDAIAFALLMFDEMLRPCSERGDFSFMVEKAIRRLYGLRPTPRMRLLFIPKRRYLEGQGHGEEKR